MSEVNVELVRRAFAALDADGIEASLAFFAPDCVWYTTDRWLESDAYHGHQGMHNLTAAFSENFDGWSYEVHETRDVGDRVVALTEMVGQIKNSGARISQPIGLVVSDFRGDAFREIRAFASWSEALASVGLQD